MRKSAYYKVQNANYDINKKKESNDHVDIQGINDKLKPNQGPSTTTATTAVDIDNIITDIMYAIADPRVRLGERA